MKVKAGVEIIEGSHPYPPDKYSAVKENCQFKTSPGKKYTQKGENHG